MTRRQILEHQLKKTFTSDEFQEIAEDDISFALAKATNIVDGYVNYTSGSELDYIVCDIALDLMITERDRSINTTPMEVPSNLASIKEGDTILTFNTDDSGRSSESSVSSRTGNDAYYIDTYRDELNRYRKMRR